MTISEIILQLNYRQDHGIPVPDFLNKTYWAQRASEFSQETARTGGPLVNGLAIAIRVTEQFMKGALKTPQVVQLSRYIALADITSSNINAGIGEFFSRHPVSVKNLLTDFSLLQGLIYQLIEHAHGKDGIADEFSNNYKVSLSQTYYRSEQTFMRLICPADKNTTIMENLLSDALLDVDEDYVIAIQNIICDDLDHPDSWPDAIRTLTNFWTADTAERALFNGISYCDESLLQEINHFGEINLPKERVARISAFMCGKPLRMIYNQSEWPDGLFSPPLMQVSHDDCCGNRGAKAKEQ